LFQQDIPLFFRSFEKEYLSQAGIGISVIIVGRHPSIQTREKCTDAISQRIIMKLRHTEESFGKLSDSSA